MCFGKDEPHLQVVYSLTTSSILGSLGKSQSLISFSFPVYLWDFLRPFFNVKSAISPLKYIDYFNFESFVKWGQFGYIPITHSDDDHSILLLRIIFPKLRIVYSNTKVRNLAVVIYWWPVMIALLREKPQVFTNGWLLARANALKVLSDLQQE